MWRVVGVKPIRIRPDIIKYQFHDPVNNRLLTFKISGTPHPTLSRTFHEIDDISLLSVSDYGGGTLSREDLGPEQVRDLEVEMENLARDELRQDILAQFAKQFSSKPSQRDDRTRI